MDSWFAGSVEERPLDRVRYVRLGSDGAWGHECLQNGTLRLHDALDPVPDVVEDDGTTIWITFHGGRLYWGRLDPARPAVAAPDSSVHFLAEPGWRGVTDAYEEQPLFLDDLAGHLGAVALEEGPICEPKEPDYVIRRIHGLESQVAMDAQDVVDAMEYHISRMMQTLTAAEFLLLVEMVFHAEGWRRLPRGVGFDEAADFVFERAAEGGRRAVDGMTDVERVAVQVALETDTEGARARVAQLRGTVPRTLFVFHTGEVDPAALDPVEVVDARHLAALVLDAGLTRWLVRRVR